MIHDSTFFLILVIIVFAVFLIAFTIQEMDRVQKVYVFERDGKIYATSYQNTSKIIEYVKEKYNDIIVLDEFEIEVGLNMVIFGKTDDKQVLPGVYGI